ncbi:response regulator transcription factor [Petrocella sp. FN5]|uniref:response regulator transcription factor n=1 Tax=Petrocella sp. FN5 TaxID=3032002 RepID=UPI0023DBFEED|nr:response regulator transcription factor [Petrocella sp. FN5]MDF1616080.1 response regulator transcription factor [Petrocella sp. FN5]
MKPVKVLIADDEKGIRNIIAEYLSQEGIEVIEAVDGVDALNQFKNHSVDLVILDVMMPKMEGWTVCKEIRKVSKIPIIMLTARGEEYDKLLGFELGIDDYVVKPFSPKELRARVKAHLARRQDLLDEIPKKQEMTFGELRINLDARSVWLIDGYLQLTPKEYELLVFFAKNPNKVFSREQLLSAVWGYDYFGDDRTVDTHVKTLREHLKSYRKWIVTIWRIGYKFDPEADL